MNLEIACKPVSVKVQGFVVADWENCPEDRKSYTGNIFILNVCPISWESRKQKTVALSSTVAEYMGTTEAAKEAIYLSRFLTELGPYHLSDIAIFNHNMSAEKLSEYPVFHARSKHIDIKSHFI
ncbi:hypothetical protein JTB14_037787 [Gonioctena quinquepunctata]|nr:hypothetical protein JTB14_037787 [Gonioctena quinquepunctata]